MVLVSTDTPSPGQLWNQAGGDGDLYRDLMRQHGLILSPGDEGYEQASRTLPCGYPGPPKPASEWADSGWVIYCRGCKQHWTDGECACTCTDGTDPHYEDWVVGADPAAKGAGHER